MGYEWMRRKDEFSQEALEVLPILSIHHDQIFFRVEGISRMTPLWDLDIAKALCRLETGGWVIFAKRILNRKEMTGLDDELYVALRERVDRIVAVKQKVQRHREAEARAQKARLTLANATTYTPY